MKKTYIRDKRSPVPKNQAVSRVMSSNKAKNTKPELTLRQLLFHNGLRGYRLNYKKVPGSPDICFVSKKIAVFVNGCYWHRCPKCDYQLPKNNTEFWDNKFERNKERDKEKLQHLKDMGWATVVIWECDLKSNPEHVLKQLTKVITFNSR
jgi:DNA mismatch endonuclease, patch repair protein